MQPRNPYEPTQVPLVVDERTLAANLEREPEYGGFWVRVGALLIDVLILIPLGAVNVAGMLWSRMYPVYSFVPGLLIAAFYWIYLVKRYGGTPGKRVLKMHIAMEDGAPITTQAAIVRYAPLYLLTIASSLASLLAALSIADDTFQSQGFLGKLQLIQAAGPSWGQWVGAVMWLWWIATAIAMACNHRRRSLHDFLAGTVVLRER